MLFPPPTVELPLPLPKPLNYQVLSILLLKISGAFPFSSLLLPYGRWALSGLPGSCPDHSMHLPHGCPKGFPKLTLALAGCAKLFGSPHCFQDKV